MTEARIPRAPGFALYARIDGNPAPNAPVLVLAHVLGLDLTMWNGLLQHLPPQLRVLRWDARGHGHSAAPLAPWSMGALVGDAEAVIDFFGIRDAVMVGMSMGGLVAQGLAVKRLDLVRGLVLSNTAARIGSPTQWTARAAQARDGGMEAVADDLLMRWFSRNARARGLDADWRPRLLACNAESYAATCEALSGADFYTTTSGLRLPVLGIAGSEDGSTPPDLIRETVDLVPGSRFHLIRRQGHVPVIEDPAGYGALLTGFLRDIGHIRSVAAGPSACGAESFPRRRLRLLLRVPPAGIFLDEEWGKSFLLLILRPEISSGGELAAGQEGGQDAPLH